MPIGPIKKADVGQIKNAHFSFRVGTGLEWLFKLGRRTKTGLLVLIPKRFFDFGPPFKPDSDVGWIETRTPHWHRSTSGVLT